MPQGRPPFAFALLDLPSDHEIDGGLVTECQVINAILHNRGFGAHTKTIRASSEEGFNAAPWKAYSALGFVHLAAHGSPKGISLIGGRIKWRDVATKLIKLAPRLTKNKRRVLSLSCCYSENGYNALEPLLKGHFTGLYHFNDERIPFATATTVWSMFYRKKTIERPALKVVESINAFFGEEVITYRSI